MVNIQPVSNIARGQGAKLIIYGPPGSGKTPLCVQATNALIMLTEPGTLSVRHHNTPAVACYEVADIEDFFTWLRSDSKEKSKFKTICVDSVSEWCSIYIRHLEGKGNKSGGDAHGKKVYGDMARSIIKDLNYLYYVSNFNVILTAKRGEVDFEGITKFRPYFPGKQLNTEVPHLFDGVFHVDKVPGIWDTSSGYPVLALAPPTSLVPAILTQETNTYVARDRSGNLNSVEYPNLDYLINKILS